jgi:hypothetical protein
VLIDFKSKRGLNERGAANTRRRQFDSQPPPPNRIAKKLEKVPPPPLFLISGRPNVTGFDFLVISLFQMFIISHLLMRFGTRREVA